MFVYQMRNRRFMGQKLLLFFLFFQIQKTQMNIVIVPSELQGIDISQVSKMRNSTVPFPVRERNEKVSWGCCGKAFVLCGSYLFQAWL